MGGVRGSRHIFFAALAATSPSAHILSTSPPHFHISHHHLQSVQKLAASFGRLFLLSPLLLAPSRKRGGRKKSSHSNERGGREREENASVNLSEARNCLLKVMEYISSSLPLPPLFSPLTPSHFPILSYCSRKKVPSTPGPPPPTPTALLLSWTVRGCSGCLLRSLSRGHYPAVHPRIWGKARCAASAAAAAHLLSVHLGMGGPPKKPLPLVRPP